MTRWNLTACLLVTVSLSTGCSTHGRAIPAPAPVSNFDYVDLQAGWRLRVVTPLGRNGNYRLKYREVSSSPGLITLETDDFQGYEVAHYTVEPHREGVRVRFRDAAHFRDGISTRVSRSVAPLFALPSQTRFVRLVYLRRASAADHNMAVVACRNAEELALLTRAAQSNDPACGKDFRCSWVPAGIAVRAERKNDGHAEWTPVR